jgi:PKD repeat protein
MAGSRVNHTFTTVGKFVVILTVWDLAQAQNHTSLTVNVTLVPKKAPVPDFNFFTEDGSRFPTVLTNLTFNSTTADPDNITEGYFWDFGDGMTEVGHTVTHKYSHYGKYNVTFTVFWNTTLNASVTKNLTVIDLSPLPKIGQSTNDTVKKFSIDFDALDTTDKDDEYNTLVFHWDFGDGTKLDGDSVSHAYVRSGLFNVTMTVVDPGGAQGQATSYVKVTNRIPKVIIKASNTTLAWNETLKLDGSGCSDPDGDPLTYSWDFGDNSTLNTNINTSPVFPAAGYYTVKLTVMDNDKGTGVATVTIHQLAKVVVTPPPKKPKKQDNTMLYFGLGALVAIIAVIAGAALMLSKKKQRPPAARTGLETDLSPGISGTAPEETLVPEGPEPPKEIPKAKAVAVIPKEEEPK